MSNGILLSVIFPFLDASEDVEGCFRALAKQMGANKKEIEIIVVNDGSQDDTLKAISSHREILKDFARFHVINHDKRMGLAKTRHDGVMAARGKFITFVDKKSRPDRDYLENMLNKGYNIVIGNYYANKNRGPWSRFLAAVRKKLYFPYYNNDFKDIELDHEAYKKFRNKGGGSVMLVRRDYYIRVAKSQRMGKDVNDDSLFVENLTKIEPLLKTSSANAEYLNREGFKENLLHLYGRGPKFVDYYIKPGTRFFPIITSLLVTLVLGVALAVLNPVWLLYEFAALFCVLVLLSLYFAEDAKDFVACITVMPLAVLAFSAGILKGLAMKILRLY